MTLRLVYEGLLIELVKTGSPSILLSDFNYFVRKAVNGYLNKKYGAVYDTTQLTADDLRVLVTSAVLDLTKADDPYRGNIWVAYLPSDYFHLLNCVCSYKILKRYRCHAKDDIVLFSARRLTSDIYPIIIQDFYQCPMPHRPYFFLHNINGSTQTPTNKELDLTTPYTVTQNEDGSVTGNSNLPRTIKLGDLWDKTLASERSSVDREIGLRYGNPSSIRIEIHCGDCKDIYEPKNIVIDYIKVPQYLELTLELLNFTLDTSLIMEFPDYVCQEVINELIALYLVLINDARYANKKDINNTIVAQQLQ